MKGKTRVISVVQFVNIAIVCLIACTISVAGGAEVPSENDMDIIWTESDGQRFGIFFSSYRSGNWEDPEKITKDDVDNLHPSIDVGPDGKKWAVWTAIDSSGFEIRYSVYSGGNWSSAEKIPSSLTSNIKPSIIVDSSNIPWVVWSGNNGGDDDIYFTRFINGSWAAEQCIHGQNSVPDILPFLDIDDQGLPVASWKRFLGSDYVEVSSTWDGGAWSAPEVVDQSTDETEERTAQESQVTLPEFVKDTRQVFLRVSE